MYFEIYGVSDALKPRFAALNFKGKPRFAALNFEGAAESWLQTLELRGRVKSWEALCQAFCDRFNKDQYQTHMRHLDSLRQTDSVAEYYASFEQISHQILLYNPQYDDVFFVIRFMNGLKEEIRAPIALHGPKNVNTASALALIQEEELQASQRKVMGKSDAKDNFKAGSRVFTTNDNAKNQARRDDGKKSDKAAMDDKWATLKAHRKANGLCFKCGEKWNHNHKCPDHVSLNVLHELMEIFQLEDGPDYASDDDVDDAAPSEAVVLAVQNSGQQQPTTPKRRTMHF